MIYSVVLAQAAIALGFFLMLFYAFCLLFVFPVLSLTIYKIIIYKRPRRNPVWIIISVTIGLVSAVSFAVFCTYLLSLSNVLEVS